MGWSCIWLVGLFVSLCVYICVCMCERGVKALFMEVVFSGGSRHKCLSTIVLRWRRLTSLQLWNCNCQWNTHKNTTVTLGLGVDGFHFHLTSEILTSFTLDCNHISFDMSPHSVLSPPPLSSSLVSVGELNDKLKHNDENKVVQVLCSIYWSVAALASISLIWLCLQSTGQIGFVVLFFLSVVNLFFSSVVFESLPKVALNVCILWKWWLHSNHFEALCVTVSLYRQ